MMKKRYLVFLLFVIVSVLYWLFIHKNENQVIFPKFNEISSSLPVAPSIAPSFNSRKESFLFVPYWSLSNKKIESDKFDYLIYFGITADEKGIDKKDLGYKKIDEFIKLSGKDNLLAIRLTDSKINSMLLDKKDLQIKLIDESISLAKKYSFRGIVFDFEMSALSFESVIRKINSFYKDYYNSTKKNDMTFLITVYGDTFYRARPYDISELSKYSDGIMIMAYDFHKSRGAPGPNFPLNGRETYGYDFKTMISDFSKRIPVEKIIVIFGLFGYDWTVDEKNQSLETAKPLSLNEIKNNFLKSCTKKDCLITKDKESLENNITYSDKNTKNHVVWFENESSVDLKINFLKENKINSIGFWAYSYF